MLNSLKVYCLLRLTLHRGFKQHCILCSTKFALLIKPVLLKLVYLCYCQRSFDHKISFVLVVQTPYLNCPVDIQVSLQGDMTGVQLGARFPQPATNIPITSVSHKSNDVFPVGMSVITFEAVSEEGVRKTCNVIVDVRGKDNLPPTHDIMFILFVCFLFCFKCSCFY